jgi:hypothetical protein
MQPMRGPGGIRISRDAVDPSVANLSALSQSCFAQKAGGLPIPGKPRSAYTPRPCFARPVQRVSLQVRAREPPKIAIYGAVMRSAHVCAMDGATD